MQNFTAWANDFNHWPNEFHQNDFHQRFESPLDNPNIPLPPAPPPPEQFLNSDSLSEISRIELASIKEYCSSGAEYLQLGPCSANYIKCTSLSTNYEEKYCPLEHVRFFFWFYNKRKFRFSWMESAETLQILKNVLISKSIGLMRQ